MAAIALSLVLGFLFIPRAGCVENKVYATGSSATLKSGSNGKLVAVEWKHNGSLVVEWNVDGTTETYRYNPTLNIENGDLTLIMKNKSYNGEYRCQYYYKKNEFLESVYNVKVIDSFSEVQVTCEKNNTGMTLLCKVESSVHANFEWKGPNGFHQSGYSVFINQSQPEDVYFCTAKNEVSSASREFTLANCAPPKTDGDADKNIVALATVISIVIIVAILGVAGVFSYKKWGYMLTASDEASGTPVELKGNNHTET